MSPEDYYGEIFDKSHDIILIADMEGHILDVNRAATRLYGYTREELRNLKPGALMAPSSRNLMHKRIEQVTQEGDAVLETTHVCKDGSIVYLEARSSVIEYEGKPAILNILRDITQRVGAEENLRRLASIVNSSEDAIFVKELDGTVISWNEGASRLYGYASDEIIGQNVSVLLPPDRADEVAKILRGIARGDRYDHFETLRVAKDGHLIDVSMTLSPVKDPAGNIIGASSVARDITARKKTEEELQRANEELAGFASVVSHDLRGPLAAVRMANETLRELLRGEQTEETKAVVEEAMELMHHSLQRADRLVDNLLRLAGAGQVPKNVERIDVRRAVERVLEERATDILERGTKVEVGDDLGEVVADFTHIYQLFSNLIGNAILHNDSDAPVVKVVRRADESPGCHRYAVCDNGSGIPEENFERIFAPFFRGKAGGTGIGLNIVQKIVKVYGGDISVHNAGGACFEFCLKDFTPAS